MKFNITESPLTDELQGIIDKQFSEYAISATGFDGESKKPVAFCINSPNNDELLGVCVVRVFWGIIHIKYLVVNEKYRGQGVGRELIRHALEYGKTESCKVAFVETLSFQAPTFYQKLGFELEFKRDGYKYGISLYYFRKEL